MHDFVTMLLLALSSAIPFLFLAAVWASVRYGPLRTRFWRGERWFGFAAFVGVLSFLVGFVGPILVVPEANQGPLLGIFFTGPLGVVVGLVWGLARAADRTSSHDD